LPHNWYKHLRYNSGKVNLNALVIFSEILYWYRPAVVKDETTGKFKGWRKKYKADKLQKSYQALADQFGLTKRQAREAIRFLEEKGLVTREFRNIGTESGLALSNVLFLGLDVERLKQITYDDPMTLECHTSDSETPQDRPRDAIRLTPQGETYTETTTKTTTDIGVGGKNERESLVLLTAAGVSETVARRLATTCTLDQVRGWVDYATTAQGVTDPAGLIVARLQDGVPPPAPIKRPEHDSSRYITGPYADLIQH
jgi:hypothetical protein